MKSFDSPVPTSIVKELFTIAHWFKKVYEGTTNGLTVAWDQFLHYLTDMMEGEAILEAPETYTLPFPASLDATSPIIPWTFECSCTSPIVVFEPDRRALYDQVCSLSASLLRGFSFKAHPEAILLREPAENPTEAAKDNPLDHLILIGGSILGSLVPSLRTGEASILDLTQPGWIATEQNVNKVVRDLEKWCPMITGTIGVIIDLFGNSSVKFRHVDGSLVLPLRVQGKYHLLGDAVVESDDGLRNLLRVVNPILECIKNYPTVVTPPMPRYVFSGCCRDEAHAPNAGEENYSKNMLAGFLHARSVVKNELVRSEALSSFWVMDSPPYIRKDEQDQTVEQKLGLVRQGLGPDGVHLTDLGLSVLLQNMSNAMVKALLKRDRAEQARAEDAAQITVSGGTFYWRGFTSPRGSVKRPATRGGTSRGGGPSRGGGAIRGGMTIRGGGSNRGGGASRGYGGSFGGGPKGRATPYDRNIKK
jgi:hypothetical protein